MPPSFVVTMSGMFVWSCNECRLILMRFRYGIKSALLLLFAFTHSRRGKVFFIAARTKLRLRLKGTSALHFTAFHIDFILLAAGSYQPGDIDSRSFAMFR